MLGFYGEKVRNAKSAVTYDPTGKDLLTACEFRNWDQAKVLIAKNPMWLLNCRNCYGGNSLHWILSSRHDNVMMLEYVYEVIMSLNISEEERQKWLANLFDGRLPFQSISIRDAIAWNDIEVIEFFIKRFGVSVLEKRDNTRERWSPAHWAAYYDYVEILEFITRRAPSGIGVLTCEGLEGETPLDIAGAGKPGMKYDEDGRALDGMEELVNTYFTPQKIRQIGFENELTHIEHAFLFESETLVSLVLSVIMQDIAVKLYQNSN